MDSKQLTALMTKRDDLITFLNANLEKQIQESQQGLLKKFLAGFGDLLQTDETGKVLNNAFNRNLLLSVDKVFADYGKQHNVLILAALMQGVNQLMDFNADYYGKFEGETKLLPIRKKVVQNMRGWLGISGENTAQENGYLSTLIKSDAVKNQIKDFALKSVMGQAGWQDTKKNLEKLIAGDKGNLGALQKYHRNFSYDLLSQVDRATGKTYADDLKFEFAIYEGGLIETSREFCKKRNGNVYHISEIQKFNPQVAKQPNYNPITDAGGYSCRHHYNWIPTALAKAMGKDVDKFLKGGDDKKIIKEINENTKSEEKQNKFNEAKNIKELKNLSKEIFKAKNIEINENEDLSLMKIRLNKLDELFNEFNIKNKNGFEKISFVSTKNREGVAKSDAEGNTISVNFGNKKQNFADFEKTDDFLNNLKLDRPNIDEKNIEFYVQTHEFAHLLDFKDLRKPLSNKSDFIKELEVINNEYKNEFSKYFDENKKMGDFKFLKPYERRIYKENLKKMSEIHLGTYANTNINEFMAEAFSEYVLSSKPSKYAEKVGKLIDKCFKKK